MIDHADRPAITIRRWLAENVTGGKDVPDDYPLIETGTLTSLQTVELLVFIEDAFCITIDDDEMTEENFGSVDAIADLVRERAT